MIKFWICLLCMWLAGPLAAADRVALVIGNAGYDNSPLANPLNDARAMERVLNELGFTVTRLEDGNRAQMMRAVQAFREQLHPGGIGLFYYSGHGVEIGGKNYLLPVQSTVRTQEDVLVEGLDAAYVVAQMDAADGLLNVLILDACRDNPLPSRSKGAGKGLARMDAASGTLIAFATAAGQTADDGSRENSPYTEVLVERLNQPGLSISEVFNEVNLEVARRTENRQRPWYSTSGVPTLRLSRAQAQVACDRLRDGSCGPELVTVPGGRFEMGSSVSDPDVDSTEQPQHLVSIRPFALAKYELTVAQFRAFTNATGFKTDAERNTPVDGEDHQGCFTYSRIEGEGESEGWVAGNNWTNPRFPQSDQSPVVCLSYNDAKAYLTWLSKETGKRYRLPSEAEQEYASRAGTRSIYPWGSDANQACQYGNVLDASGEVRFPNWTAADCDDGAIFTSPVGRFAANSFGIHDSTGNAAEWAEDCFHENYEGAPSDGSPWVTGDCELRVIDGQAWTGTPTDYRAASRSGVPPSDRYSALGMRVARDL